MKTYWTSHEFGATVNELMSVLMEAPPEIKVTKAIINLDVLRTAQGLLHQTNLGIREAGYFEAYDVERIAAAE